MRKRTLRAEEGLRLNLRVAQIVNSTKTQQSRIILVPSKGFCVLNLIFPVERFGSLVFVRNKYSFASIANSVLHGLMVHYVFADAAIYYFSSAVDA